MAHSAKFLMQAGCSNPGLAGFAQRFVDALGPVDDVAETSALLGRQGRRINDAAMRRRLISARIALMADDGSRSATTAPEGMVKDETPAVVMIDASPLAGQPSVAELVVPPTALKREFQMQSLADVARLLSVEDDEVAEPVQAKVIEAVDDLASDKADIEAETVIAEEVEINVLPSPQINFSAGPPARYSQESTRVMNVARDSDEPAPPKKKKKRQKPTDPIDFSALAQLGSEKDSPTSVTSPDVNPDEEAAPPAENPKAD